MTALECDASGFLRLCDVSRLTERELPLAMRRIGSRARDVAQSMAPVRTSRLRTSIASQTGRDGSTNVEYGPYVEYGTGRRGSDMYVANDGSAHTTEGLVFRNDWQGMGPEPYIRPALYDQKALYMAVISDAVKRSIRQGGGSA